MYRKNYAANLTNVIADNILLRKIDWDRISVIPTGKDFNFLSEIELLEINDVEIYALPNEHLQKVYQQYSGEENEINNNESPKIADGFYISNYFLRNDHQNQFDTIKYINDLSSKQGIPQEIGLLGLLYQGIFFNKDLTPQRQLEVVAHEIAHKIFIDNSRLLFDAMKNFLDKETKNIFIELLKSFGYPDDEYVLFQEIFTTTLGLLLKDYSQFDKNSLVLVSLILKDKYFLAILKTLNIHNIFEGLVRNKELNIIDHNSINKKIIYKNDQFRNIYKIFVYNNLKEKIDKERYITASIIAEYQNQVEKSNTPKCLFAEELFLLTNGDKENCLLLKKLYQFIPKPAEGRLKEFYLHQEILDIYFLMLGYKEQYPHLYNYIQAEIFRDISERQKDCDYPNLPRAYDSNLEKYKLILKRYPKMSIEDLKIIEKIQAKDSLLMALYLYTFNKEIFNKSVEEIVKYKQYYPEIKNNWYDLTVSKDLNTEDLSKVTEYLLIPFLHLLAGDEEKIEKYLKNICTIITEGRIRPKELFKQIIDNMSNNALGDSVNIPNDRGGYLEYIFDYLDFIKDKIFNNPNISLENMTEIINKYYAERIDYINSLKEQISLSEEGSEYYRDLNDSNRKGVDNPYTKNARKIWEHILNNDSNVKTAIVDLLGNRVVEFIELDGIEYATGYMRDGFLELAANSTASYIRLEDYKDLRLIEVKYSSPAWEQDDLDKLLDKINMYLPYFNEHLDSDQKIIVKPFVFGSEKELDPIFIINNIGKIYIANPEQSKYSIFFYPDNEEILNKMKSYGYKHPGDLKRFNGETDNLNAIKNFIYQIFN